MADGRHLKKTLNRHISATVLPILMNLALWNILASYSGPTVKNSNFSNHQIFQWMVILSNQPCLPWQFTIIGWSVSSRPNTPYRPHLCSHDVSKTDLEWQAPDIRHQAPYISDTCFVWLIYVADTWTLLSADVRTLDAFHQKCLRQTAWNPMVWPSPKWRSTTADRSDFTVLSRSRSMHLCIWARASTWRWHTGKHGISGCTSYETIPPDDGQIWHARGYLSYPLQCQTSLWLVYTVYGYS